MTPKEYTNGRDPEINFYAMKPGESREVYKARIDEYESETLQELLKDPGRKNVQTYDDGSRRERQEELTQLCPVVSSASYGKKLARLGAWAVGLTALTIAGIKCANSYLEAAKVREDAQTQHEQDRKAGFDPAHNEILKGWEQEAQESN